MFLMHVDICTWLSVSRGVWCVVACTVVFGIGVDLCVGRVVGLVVGVGEADAGRRLQVHHVRELRPRALEAHELRRVGRRGAERAASAARRASVLRRRIASNCANYPCS